MKKEVLLIMLLMMIISTSVSSVYAYGVTDCYNTGSVTATGTDYGPIVGKMYDNTFTVNNSFYLDTTASEGSNVLGVSQTQTEMESPSFVELLNGNPSLGTWKAGTSENSGYPMLIWQTISTGTNIMNTSFADIYHSKGKLYITNNDKGSDVCVYNMLGAVVLYTKAVNTQEIISLETIPNGLYVVRIGSGNISKSIKIIK